MCHIEYGIDQNGRGFTDFGAILEQSGFSTSKKLVGLFYGYDFRILRVFFTAGAVAMVGVIAFNNFGIIDMSLVYVNPTFLWSAIIGGLIMGLGFVVGGFCPGTSICAAAIGKIDAMVFIVEAFIGVLIFAEGYPFFEGLYKASNSGSPQMFETLGISHTVLALCLIKIEECNKNQIFDFRSEDDRKALPLPKSNPITMDDLFAKEPIKLLKILHRDNIFIANDEITERRMALLATKLGYNRIKILKGGMDGFKKDILGYQPLTNPQTVADKDRNEFRLYAQSVIQQTLMKFKPSENTKSDKPKRVLGGC